MQRIFWASAAAAIAVMSYVDSAAAEVTYPYCAMRGGRGGYESCGYISFAQCLATIRGAGGWCQVNPRYAAARYPDAPLRTDKARRFADN